MKWNFSQHKGWCENWMVSWCENAMTRKSTGDCGAGQNLKQKRGKIRSFFFWSNVESRFTTVRKSPTLIQWKRQRLIEVSIERRKAFCHRDQAPWHEKAHILLIWTRWICRTKIENVQAEVGLVTVVLGSSADCLRLRAISDPVTSRVRSQVPLQKY